MRRILLLLLVLLSSCSISFKSGQIDALRSQLFSSKDDVLRKQWLVLFDGLSYEAYALISDEKYVLYTLGYIEVDFIGTYISEVRVFSPMRRTIHIEPTQQGFQINDSREDAQLDIGCSEFEPRSQGFYTQACRDLGSGRTFVNQLRVNDLNEIVWARFYYEPDNSPIELYFGEYLNSLGYKQHD